ncbi:esterase-like activity of phytase family protein [Larkinella sp. VNQ87]|uniref:esterase-like activity of phytase family protein n=1 Tax=Larkinella sp. VNQ87 TaxID=3400921 RepID=UPI003BFF8BA1
MKFFLLSFLFLFPLFARSQALSFLLKDYLILPHTRNLHRISGLEYRSDRREWQLADDRGQYHIFRNIRQPTDWVCQLDSSFRTDLYLEAVRYDAAADRYYFSVETDQESYVGFKDHAMPKTGESFMRIPLPHPLPVDHNKGIEALALTPNYLWVAPEAGSVAEARIDNPFIHFYRYRKTAEGVILDGEFQYEMARNVCPSDSNECLGGISEIISIPDEENRLLVLERCYDKTTKTVTAKLYEALVDEANKQLCKRTDQPAFDFNYRNGFQPDNLEAMAWGEDENGKKILVLISDDNNNRSQWTQIIYLELQPN